MEGGSLFNPGFLGGAFLWWVGQIVDDSTWRDNTNSGKYQDRTSIPGWGRRYKVRIIGLHDQGEKTIPSDQLPWAQPMYPVTVVVVKQEQWIQPSSVKGTWSLGFSLMVRNNKFLSSWEFLVTTLKQFLHKRTAQ